MFFFNGAIFGTWVSRVPAVASQVHAGTGALGLALLGFGLGALAARQAAGQLVVRMGSHAVVRMSIALSCAMLLLPALATNIALLGVSLILFGVAQGFLDLAVNANGVAVQDRIGRPVMSSFHGAYSVGGLAAAAGGGVAAAAGVRPALQFFLVATIIGCLAMLVSPLLLPQSRLAGRQPGTGRGWAKVAPQYRLALVLLGLIGLCSMMGEGAVGDWGAVYLHSDLRADPSLASSGFAAYSLAMATGRLAGDRFVARWGGLRVIAWSAAVAGAGFAAALLIDTPAAAICGFTVLGLGLASIIPVTFSMASRLGDQAAGPEIAVVSSIAIMGSLAGPPVIGFAAAVVRLPAALGLVSILAFAVMGLAWAVKPMAEPVPADRPAMTPVPDAGRLPLPAIKS